LLDPSRDTLHQAVALVHSGRAIECTRRRGLVTHLTIADESGTVDAHASSIRQMKASHLSLTVALTAVALGAGCAASENAMETNTGRKAAGGALAGAVLGGIIGNNTGGSTEKGAAIGAVAGGLAGAAVGHQQDKRADNTAYNNGTYSTYDTNQIVVQQPPLAPTSAPYEQIPARPYPNAVWIPGHYNYTGSNYAWESGRWETPPSGTSTWVPPTWQPTNGGYVYVRGHWQ
jgi:hypothetical protein